LEDIVEDFIDHGLVYRTIDPKGMMLGRPPDQVLVLEILQLVCHREIPPVQHDRNTIDPVGSLLQQRDQAIRETLNGMTLHMLAVDEPAALILPQPSSLLLDQSAS
jgi:DNA-binding IscR family transcriptional regulator